jgi:hypothetical protein
VKVYCKKRLLYGAIQFSAGSFYNDRFSPQAAGLKGMHISALLLYGIVVLTIVQHIDNVDFIIGLEYNDIF